MPNYGLVVTPEYSPMTFQEYAAPFEKYAEVYNQMADQYDALEMEASKWEKLANSAIDQAEYKQYQAYANSLRQVADELATTGLSTKTRGAVSDMKRRFAAEILPIEQAWNLREEERKLQKEAMVRNPYIRFNRNASSTGLSSYMAGSPELSTIDLAQIKANVMNDAKPLAEELRDLQSGKVIKDSKWKKILGGQYWEFVKGNGFTSEAINQAITQMLDPRNNTSPEQFEILNTIVNGAVESSGVTNWDLYNNNDSFRREVLNAATSGLWQAIGKTDFEHLSNKNWELQNSGSGGDKPSVSSKPVERTTTILVDENPRLTEKYSELYDKYSKELPDELKTLRGVSTPSELMQSYNKFIEDYNSNTQESEQKLQQAGITNIYKKYVGTWMLPDINLTEQEKKGLIQQVRKETNGRYNGYSDRVVMLDDKYYTAEQSIKNSKWANNKELIESLRLQHTAKENFDKDVKRYKLSDKEKEILKQLNITEEDFYADPKSAKNLVSENTLTYLNATNEAGQDFKKDILGTIRRNTLGKTGIEMYEIRTKNGSKDKIKDKKIQDLLADDNIEAVMIDPKTLKNKELTLQDIEGNYYSIPLEYLGENVLDALTSPTFTIKINNTDKSISLLDYWNLAVSNKRLDLAHEIEVQIADVISGEFNYNFYQKQGNTQKE